MEDLKAIAAEFESHNTGSAKDRMVSRFMRATIERLDAHDASVRSLNSTVDAFGDAIAERLPPKSAASQVSPPNPPSAHEQAEPGNIDPGDAEAAAAAKELSAEPVTPPDQPHRESDPPATVDED